MDFDRFKLVNDSFGHDVGDELLKQIAERLHGSLRRNDGVEAISERSTPARSGGDEFVILLEDLHDPNDALLVADRLLVALEDPYFLTGQRVVISASIGVVNDTQAYTTPDEVLRDADTAMYEAKSAGRGRFVLFDKAMHTKAKDRLRTENDLRCAISNGELFLEYQPLVELETGRATGFEALVRWKHPQRGLIMPTAFLPTAEDSGLIVAMGAWVLDKACQEFASWRRSLGDDAPSHIHINVSRKQLLHGLAENVRTVLEKYDIPPECLHLEVTESEIMQNPEVAKATLHQLRRIGVKIDMDDFGTGHSSLACLQELPIDVIKVDKSLIANMDRRRSFAALIHAVTTFGQNLGMTVVAEGIETAEQLVMMQSMECEFGQGYFFAKPMPAEEVRLYLLQAGNLEFDTRGVYSHRELAAVCATSDLLCQ